MYSFELSDKFLSDQEENIFEDYLKSVGLDNSIWAVFSSLFEVKTNYTKPLLLRVYKDDKLFGAAIIIKCNRYSKSLFNNFLLCKLIDFINIPCYLWIRFGCCMDMMSNPGFVKDPEKAREVFRAMAMYLRKNTILTLINDYSTNTDLYPHASILPALPHALIDCSNMNTIDDYTKNFKNIKRKIRVFKKKLGAYHKIEKQLNKEQLIALKKCFVSTTEKSMLYLPYQDLYLKAAMNTSQSNIENVHYFIATLNNEFLGYQASIQSGNKLNALHGAFNRNLKTTYHAYDILFVKMTEFAIQNGLKIIDFGAVINQTKEKMINKSVDMSYFILSKYSFVQKFFNSFLKTTKIQDPKLMKYRGS